MKNETYKVGQPLFTIIKGTITEYTIVKVGRKYLTVAQVDTERHLSYDERKVSIHSLYEATKWGSPIKFYQSKQEIAVSIERTRIVDTVRHEFADLGGAGKQFSLTALRSTDNIVKEELKCLGH